MKEQECKHIEIMLAEDNTWRCEVCNISFGNRKNPTREPIQPD